MRKSFVSMKAPVVTGSVHEKSAETSIHAIKDCVLNGADAIDLHIMDFCEADLNIDTLKRIVEACLVPMLGLNYNICQDEAAEEKRLENLYKVAEAGAAGIDIQGYSYSIASRDRFDEKYADADYPFVKFKPKEVVLDEKIIERQCKLIDKVHSIGAEVLLSNHIGTFVDSDGLVSLCNFLQKRNLDTIKIVMICDTDEQLAEMIRAMIRLKNEISVPVTLICNGKHRTISRILNALLGGYNVFVQNGYSRECSNMGQPDIKAIKTIIDTANRLLLTVEGHGIND